jgi:hypothetical protein
LWRDMAPGLETIQSRAFFIVESIHA